MWSVKGQACKKASTFAYLLLATVIFAVFDQKAAEACPGSPALKSAKCEMNVTFDSDCAKVMAEINGRIAAKKGWVDPHNQGTYKLLSTEKNKKIEASRATGNGKYTDLLDFEFSAAEGKNKCVVTACSQSQVFSILDFSTNYCNLRSLYCNKSNDTCPIVSSDLKYKEIFLDCWQHDATKCITNKTDTDASA